jgi:hypothetical protein
MTKSLLLPREKYAEASQRWGKSPIMMEIEKNNQTLFYFGANHSKDPKNHQYPILKEYWEKFLQKTINKERIILIEGGLRPLATNEEIAITRNAEAGYVTFISNKSNTLIVSPDINEDELIKRLPDLNKEEFLLYWFLLLIDTYQRFANPKPDFNNFFDNWRNYQHRKDIWGGIEISFEHLKDLYKNIIGKDFNADESQNNYVNPNNTGTKINEVARKSSDARDENIVEEILKYWKEGKNIFVVFGSGHLIIQEPALKALLK